MLTRLFIVSLLLLTNSPLNAATLKGVILVNELSGSPIENVEVDTPSGAKHTESDSSGRFTLEFPQRRVGDLVRVLVKKEGYVVVNGVQLQSRILADADAKPLIIILAKEADLEEMAHRFYRLKSFEAIEETYKKRFEELQSKHIADAAAIAELKQERNQAKAAAEKASEGLARYQSGRSSELYQDAKRLFLDGKIDAAIELLDDKKLHPSLAETKEVIEDVVQAWLLKAQILTVQFRFEDAERAYKAAIDAAPENVDANFAFARFNQGLNRHQQAMNGYSRCLELARKSENNVELARTLNILGNIDSRHDRMEEARKEYGEALQIRRELAQKNPENLSA